MLSVRNELFAHAEPFMGDFISALLDTGCRQGELRSLQFSQVRLKENVFLLTADKTKTRKARAVPITARLRAVLQRRQSGPDGQTLGPGCYTAPQVAPRPRAAGAAPPGGRRRCLIASVLFTW